MRHSIDRGHFLRGQHTYSKDKAGHVSHTNIKKEFLMFWILLWNRNNYFLWLWSEHFSLVNNNQFQVGEVEMKKSYEYFAGEYFPLKGTKTVLLQDLSSLQWLILQGKEWGEGEGSSVFVCFCKIFSHYFHFFIFVLYQFFIFYIKYFIFSIFLFAGNLYLPPKIQRPPYIEKPPP